MIITLNKQGKTNMFIILHILFTIITKQENVPIFNDLLHLIGHALYLYAAVQFDLCTYETIFD